jgi:prophage tail gpP-like protein
MSNYISGKAFDELTLVIENREIVISSGKLLKTIDTGAHAFTCVMPWEPDLDLEIDEITAPYSYSEVQIYIAGYLQMTGILYGVHPKQDISGTIRELSIYTKTADMIDSTWRPPYEENNISLDTLCANQASNFNIDVVLDSGVDVGGKFSRISINQTDKCFEQLAKVAAQRGLLLSCNKYSNLLIVKPNVNGNPIGTLYVNNPVTGIYEADYNGRNRFYQYEAILSSASADRTKTKQKAVDPFIPQTRFTTFKADECLPGEGLNAAEWKRNKTAAESNQIAWPVNTWYAPNNELFEVNKTITVNNPVIGSDGFTFLITQVEYNYEVTGTTAILQLKPPSMYELGAIEEPWN